MIQPDGFTGMMLALESVYGLRVLLNGPGGCRNRHAVLARQLVPESIIDGVNRQTPYFRGQSGLPCTYMSEGDFINGAFDKLVDALRVIRTMCDDTVVIVDSPGSALIGDNHAKAIADSGMEGKAFGLAETKISCPFSESYDVTIKEVLEHLDIRKGEKIPGTVNIIGFPITDKDWKSGLNLIKTLLKSMGLRVIATIGAGASIDELKECTNAEYNVVVYPEFANNVARYMEDEFDIPSITMKTGAPIGLDATRSWIEKVAETTGKDPAAALESLESTRTRIVNAIRSDSAKSRALKCLQYSVTGVSSLAYPLTRWLYEFAGMVPASVIITDEDPAVMSSFKAFLAEHDLSFILGAKIPEFCDVILTNGHEAVYLEETKHCTAGIDISFPTHHEISILPRPIVGDLGSMYIIEEILNKM